MVVLFLVDIYIFFLFGYVLTKIVFFFLCWKTVWVNAVVAFVLICPLGRTCWGRPESSRAGVMAGICGSVVICPIVNLKTRLQIHSGTALGAARALGVRGMYRAYYAEVVACSIGRGTYFFSYEATKVMDRFVRGFDRFVVVVDRFARVRDRFVHVFGRFAHASARFVNVMDRFCT